jgi:hypothetical protein
VPLVERLHDPLAEVVTRLTTLDHSSASASAASAASSSSASDSSR